MFQNLTYFVHQKLLFLFFFIWCDYLLTILFLIKHFRLNLSSNQLQWFDYAFIPSSLELLDIHCNNIGKKYALKMYDRFKENTGFFGMFVASRKRPEIN